MIRQCISLDMVPGAAKATVTASQYDTGARVLVFRLRNGMAAFPVGEGITALIHGIKPDETYWAYDCEIEDGNVVADCTEQMTAVPGLSECEIRLSNADGHVGSCNFFLSVEKSPMTDGVISETDIPVFEQLVERAETAANSATDSASAASDSASNASDSATAASNSASAASESASEASGYAIAANASAEASAASADESGTYADRAARDAEQAFIASESASGSASRAAASESASASSAAASAASAVQAGEYAADANRDADRAEQAANTAGYMEIEVDGNGHLIYTRTDAVDVTFNLDADGHLLMEAV